MFKVGDEGKTTGGMSFEILAIAKYGGYPIQARVNKGCAFSERVLYFSLGGECHNTDSRLYDLVLSDKDTNSIPVTDYVESDVCSRQPLVAAVEEQVLYPLQFSSHTTVEDTAAPLAALFDPTKPVQTRDGRTARIICTDVESKEAEYPWIAYLWIGKDKLEHTQMCNRFGRLNRTYKTVFDLINIPEVTFPCLRKPTDPQSQDMVYLCSSKTHYVIIKSKLPSLVGISIHITQGSDGTCNILDRTVPYKETVTLKS